MSGRKRIGIHLEYLECVLYSVVIQSTDRAVFDIRTSSITASP